MSVDAAAERIGDAENCSCGHGVVAQFFDGNNYYLPFVDHDGSGLKRGVTMFVQKKEKKSLAIIPGRRRPMEDMNGSVRCLLRCGARARMEEKV